MTNARLLDYALFPLKQNVQGTAYNKYININISNLNTNRDILSTLPNIDDIIVNTDIDKNILDGYLELLVISDDIIDLKTYAGILIDWNYDPYILIDFNNDSTIFYQISLTNKHIINQTSISDNINIDNSKKKILGYIVLSGIAITGLLLSKKK